jgi:hypothetical protein
MLTIHCDICGGFIGNPAGTTYREPSVAPAPTPVAPTSAFCTCDHAVVYGPPPEPVDAVPGVHHIRSASRN